MEVKIARIRKGLTQEQLRGIVGISPQTLVAIEKGQYQKVSITLAKKLAKALDITVEELFLKD
ncbi:MAG: helix-turn-helix domain-containing protein [Clostridiaceae bacterium]|nr:helix-turn-helix domain-containing protein [Clostridiaceae bacterium]